MFNASRGCALTIDHEAATLTVDPDPHYGDTTVLELSRVVEIRHTGLSRARDLVMICTPPGHRPCSVPFETEAAARSFASSLTEAVESARRAFAQRQQEHTT